METSQPLSIESFSYSWLVNLKPSPLESLESSLRTSLDASSDEASFIEMDPKSPPSKRFFKNSVSQDSFKFDFPISQSNLALVDADELFSNGYLLPLFVESLKIEAGYDEASESSNPSLPSPSHDDATQSVAPIQKGHSRCPSLKRCRTLSRRMFHKYLNFLWPLCIRLRGHNHKSGSNTEAVKNNRGCYSETSPRISIAYSPDDWRKSCDSESSIHEAVLHCKRSIGMHKFNMDNN